MVLTYNTATIAFFAGRSGDFETFVEIKKTLVFDPCTSVFDHLMSVGKHFI